MNFIKKILKYSLPLAAAGMIYCGSARAKEEITKPIAIVTPTEKKDDNFHLSVGLEFLGCFNGNPLEKAPKSLEEEAANPYMVFNGEVIDSTTLKFLVPYKVPDLHISDFGLGLRFGMKYNGLSIESIILMRGITNSSLQNQAPQPHVSMSYYDIRYRIDSEVIAFPLSLRVGYELNINDFVPSINFNYINIMSYKIYQGIESYSQYKESRIIASGTGHLHSFGLGLNYLLSLRDKDKSKIKGLFRNDAKLELGLRLNYEFGNIRFNSGESIKFNDVSLAGTIGLRF